MASIVAWRATTSSLSTSAKSSSKSMSPSLSPTSPVTADSESSCAARAQTSFERFETPLEFNLAGEASATVDDFAGSGEGARCDVTQSVNGFTDQEGSTIRYVRFACPNVDDGWIEAIELTNDAVSSAENRQDLMAATCGSELPPPAPAEEPETPAEEKKQWVPGG